MESHAKATLSKHTFKNGYDDLISRAAALGTLAHLTITRGQSVAWRNASTLARSVRSSSAPPSK